MEIFRSPLWIFLCFWMGILAACDSKEPNNQTTVSATPTDTINTLTPSKRTFLHQIDILRYPEKIYFDLNSEGITLRDVQTYCLSEDSANREAALITAMCAGNENTLSEQNSDYWGGILYDMETFASIVRRLKQPEHRVFMDVGSGNGDKLYAALCLGFQQVLGLEYSEDLASISKRFLTDYQTDSTVVITHGDALEVPASYYQQADFIYMYSPIKSHEVMAGLYERIMQNLRVGGIFLEVRFVYAKELRERTQLNIPEFAGVFAIQRTEEDRYECLIFDESGITERIPLLPL